MNITYQNTITVDEVNGIRKSMGWRQNHPEQMQKYLSNAQIISAYEKDKAVGVAVLRENNLDLLIDPEYQYQGIEKEFLERIFVEVQSKLKPGFGLQIDIRAWSKQQIALYENLGFQISTPEKRGVPMHICLTNQIELTDRMFKQMGFE